MNKYIKEKCNLDEDTKEWAVLKLSAFYKDEYKEKLSEIEIIDSYCCAMNLICDQILNELSTNMIILKNYSFNIPYLFICRHLIELILKRAIEKRTNKVETGHNILNLWKKCKNHYKDIEEELNYYNELIDTIDLLDNNGEKFRYTKDKNGNQYESKQLFINVNLIREDINKLKEILLKSL